MKTPYAACQYCPLKDTKHTFVQAYGPANPKLIVVTDRPGQDDAHHRLILAGQSGRLVRGLLEQHGLDHKEDVFYLTAAACWPRSKVADSTPVITSCRDYLEHQLRQLPDVPVLALGDWAMQSLGLSVAERWEREQLTGKWALGAISPSLVLRFPDKFKSLEMAVKKVLAPRREYIYPGDLSVAVDPLLPDLNQDFGLICVDIETTSTDWTDGEIFLVGIATQSGTRIILTRESLKQAETHAWLRALFTHHGHKIGGHNFKFDLLYLHRVFDVPLVLGWDTISMVNVFHENWHKGLKELSTYFFDADDYAKRLVTDYLDELPRKEAKTYDKVPQKQIIEYLLCDIQYNLDLAFRMEALLEAVGRWEMPYQGHDLPQVQLLAEVEAYGVPIDRDQILVEQAAMQRVLDAMRQVVEDLTEGIVINPNSSQQVGKYLYEHLKLKVKSKTATGKPSTSEAALLDYKNLPAVGAILYYRRVLKLKSSYLDNLLQFMRRDRNGVWKVHPTFKHWNVVTHRLSAENPAIQTIPHRDVVKDSLPENIKDFVMRRFPDVDWSGDYGNRIKKCYVPSPGNVWVGADGSGWEVATATAQSLDSFLMAAFNRGESPHNAVCDMLYGPGWTKAQKVKEKNVFFGWMYGGSTDALVHETGLPKPDVAQVVAWLEKNLVELQEWRLQLMEQAKAGKIVVPFFNYTIHFDLITDAVLKDIPKVAVNWPNQGIGSMIISRAAIKANPKLKALGGHVMALIHDAFEADVPERHAMKAAQIMRAAIIEAGLDVYAGLKWDGEVEMGYRWGDLRTVSPEELENV